MEGENGGERGKCLMEEKERGRKKVGEGRRREGGRACH